MGTRNQTTTRRPPLVWNSMVRLSSTGSVPQALLAGHAMCSSGGTQAYSWQYCSISLRGRARWSLLRRGYWSAPRRHCSIVAVTKPLRAYGVRCLARTKVPTALGGLVMRSGSCSSLPPELSSVATGCQRRPDRQQQHDKTRCGPAPDGR
jgi:hypothetical protein